jgi:hypothetical protein
VVGAECASKTIDRYRIRSGTFQTACVSAPMNSVPPSDVAGVVWKNWKDSGRPDLPGRRASNARYDAAMIQRHGTRHGNEMAGRFHFTGRQQELSRSAQVRHVTQPAFSRRLRSLENVDTDVSALYESHACQAVLHAVKARTDERRKHCGMPRPAPPHATSTTRFSPHIAHR